MASQDIMNKKSVQQSFFLCNTGCDLNFQLISETRDFINGVLCKGESRESLIPRVAPDGETLFFVFDHLEASFTVIDREVGEKVLILPEGAPTAVITNWTEYHHTLYNENDPSSEEREMTTWSNGKIFFIGDKIVCIGADNHCSIEGRPLYHTNPDVFRFLVSAIPSLSDLKKIVECPEGCLQSAKE